jgi:uncharacterized protein (DUF58 family)
LSLPSVQSSVITSTVTPRWARSVGLIAGALAAVMIGAVALIASRPDIALLALPLVAAVVVSWERRPASVVRSIGRLVVAEAVNEEIAYSLTISAPPEVEAFVLRCSILAGDTRELVVTGPLSDDLSGIVPLLHSGPQELVRFEYRLLGPDATTIGIPDEPLVATRAVESQSTRIRVLPMPRRLRGLTGSHESTRMGDGGDFRDIHPFTVGDRLRRIDWKATARHAQNPGDLYVRRTAALADATVLIVLDSRDDVGEQVAEWSRNAAAVKGTSSLDLAREAATSIATGYIHAGDRVGFQDLSSRARMIAHGGGSRHLQRLLRAIEITAPSTVPFSHQRPPIVPQGALVYVLSSLLDDRAVDLSLVWHSKGHRVIVVDVLPPPRFAHATRYQRLAYRVVLMERADRVRLLRTRGVEFLRWPEGDSSLPRHARLQILARPSRRSGAWAGVQR